MPVAVLLRRPGWGVDFGKVVNIISSKIKSVKSTGDYKKVEYLDDGDFVINWGFNDAHWSDRLITLNKPEAMRLASDKRRFRQVCMEEGDYHDLIPMTYFNTRFAEDFDGVDVIVRPRRHMQGQHLYRCQTMEEVRDAARRCGKGYYISEYIPKVAEYRAYIVGGRIFGISKKVVEDPSAIAWNHAGGECEFVNVRWDDWPLSVADVAVRAFALSGLHFGGVDVMVDEEGRAYVLEVNAAISLPLLEDDGSFLDRISYHQKAMIKCLEWLVDGKDPVYDYKGKKENSYHHYIHAAMKDKGDG